MNILEQIEEQIAMHEKAIATLTIAHGVVLQLLPTEKTRPTAKQTTHKKVKYKRVIGEVRGAILEAVNRLGKPSPSKEIWHEVADFTGKDVTQKRVWNAMHVMVKRGDLNRSSDGLYGLPPKVVPASDVAAA